jgi:hypothetical protein
LSEPLRCKAHFSTTETRAAISLVTTANTEAFWPSHVLHFFRHAAPSRAEEQTDWESSIAVKRIVPNTIITS